jgi:hypothetical protein
MFHITCYKHLVQSIQLEREPFESEVKAELRRREEEKRMVAKKQRKPTLHLDSNSVDRLAHLEARVQDGEEELPTLKDEVRNLIEEVRDLKEVTKEGRKSWRSSRDFEDVEEGGEIALRGQSQKKR